MEAKAPDVLANERTFLAYVRTSLSFIAFGFVIARFGLFLQRLSQLTHMHSSTHYSSAFGDIMAALGVAIGLLGGWRYAVTDGSLQSGKVRRLTPAVGYIISIVVAAIGLFVALFLSSYK